MSLSKDYARETCKIGQGADCCKYLCAGPEGLFCAKLTTLRWTIDKRTDMTAQGDNCDGVGSDAFIDFLKEDIT